MSELLSLTDSAARAFGDQPAFISGELSLNWKQVHGRVAGISESFRTLHVGAGDRVAFVEPNSIELALMILGAMECGAIACPINPKIPQLPQSEVTKELGAKRSEIDTLDWDLISHFSPANRKAFYEIDQPATMIFTSGSSGLPKAAILSIGNHYYNAIGANENIPFVPGDRWLMSLPLYHVGGLAILFRALCEGGAVVFPEQEYDTLECVGRFGITHLSLVSTQLYRLLSRKMILQRTKSTLQGVILGGSGFSTALIDWAVQAELPIHTSYGLTEMGSQVCTTRPGESQEKLYTSGKLLPRREMRLGDDGEIFVRGQTRFLGYYEKGRITEPFDADGWFATGDLGEVDADGYLIVKGRKDNMFVSGGENIYCEEIESAIDRLPGVEKSLVIALGNEEFGARPVAFVKSNQNAPVNPVELADRLKGAFPGFKVPDHFLPWPDDVPAAIKPDRAWFARRAAEMLKK